MAGKSLAQRLLIKPGHKVRVYQAPEDYLDLLGDLPEDVQIVEKGGGKFDGVHLFAKNSAELNREAPKAMKALKAGGLLWIAYPKVSSKVETDLTRDKGWEVVESAGWRGIAQVRVDDTWAATRFRPLEDIGT